MATKLPQPFDSTKSSVYEQNFLSEYHIRYGGYGGYGGYGNYYVSDKYIALGLFNRGIHVWQEKGYGKTWCADARKQ